MISQDFGFLIRLAQDNDFPALAVLEAQSFPADEAASEETMRMRCALANPYFVVVQDDSTGGIVGFINGTCSVHKEIHHDSMSSHDPTGAYLVIHSVTVASEYRRRAIGIKMLQDYIHYLVHFRPEIVGVNLLSKAYLLCFYQQAGFTVTGLSNVEHGQEQWFDMALDLTISRRKLYVVDAFTSQSLTGNSAAVLIGQYPPDLMQSIAMETNKPITVFLSPRLHPIVSNDESNSNNSNSNSNSNSNRKQLSLYFTEYDIRWFTPLQEMSICGHGTLAAAYILYNLTTGAVRKEHEIVFFPSASTAISLNTIRAQCLFDNRIQLSFPVAIPTTIELSSDSIGTLINAFSVQSSPMESIIATESVGDMLLVELSTCAFHSVSTAAISTLSALPSPIRKVIITCRGGQSREGVVTRLDDKFDVDYYCRCILLQRSGASDCVVGEDAVTGSAHCALCPYWSKRICPSSISGCSDDVAAVDVDLISYQCSPRGGLVFNRLSSAIGDVDKEGLVHLGGYCTLMMSDHLII